MPLVLMVTGWLIKAINQAPKKFRMLSGVSSAFVLHAVPESWLLWSAVVSMPVRGWGLLGIISPAARKGSYEL